MGSEKKKNHYLLASTYFGIKKLIIIYWVQSWVSSPWVEIETKDLNIVNCVGSPTGSKLETSQPHIWLVGVISHCPFNTLVWVGFITKLNGRVLTLYTESILTLLFKKMENILAVELFWV